MGTLWMLNWFVMWFVAGISWETSKHPCSSCISMCAVSNETGRLPGRGRPSSRNGCECCFQESGMALCSNPSWGGRVCKLCCLLTTGNTASTSACLQTTTMLGNTHRHISTTTGKPNRQREDSRRHKIRVWWSRTLLQQCRETRALWTTRCCFSMWRTKCRPPLSKSCSKCKV